MDSENRSKRDLPEVVSDILITLDKIEQRQGRMEQHLDRMEQHLDRMEQRQDRMEQHLEKVEERLENVEHRLESLEQTTREGFERLASSFDNMTTAVLDAMNRQDRPLRPYGRRPYATRS